MPSERDPVQERGGAAGAAPLRVPGAPRGLKAADVFAARAERLHQGIAHHHAAERRVTRGHALGKGDDVRLVAVTLRAEVVAQPAECADDLVGDQQHPMPVADLPNPGEVPRRRREAAARVLHRLQEHGGDRLRALPLDRPLDLVGGPPAERLQVAGDKLGRPVEVGVRHPHPAGCHRLEWFFDAGEPGDRERTHGRAVVGDVTADDLVPPGLADRLEVLLGQLPGGLDRLRAAGGEKGAVQIARRQRRQPFGQLDRPRVRVRPEREVGEFRGLARAGLGHLGPAVPDLAHEQPGQAVQVTLAAVVVDVLPGPPDDHGHVALGIGRHAGEMQPQVAVGGRLQVALRSLAAGIAGAVRNTHLVPQL